MIHERGAEACVALPQEQLCRLMPMHLIIDRDTMITTCGPTLAKLVGEGAIGKTLGEVFELRRPHRADRVEDLIDQPMLSLAMRRDSAIRFKGVAVWLGCGDRALLNLSFGYSLVEAVRRHGLSERDFAATDLAIELLYLIEAKSVITREVERMTLRLRAAKQQAELRAQTDALTGLGNRRAFDDRIQHLLSRRQPFCLIHVDLDFFKDVNDSFGHAAGDHVLVEVASLLGSVLRSGDCVARLGGDEFAILLGGLGDPEALVPIGERLLRRASAPIPYMGHACRIALSMGAVVHSPDAPDSPEQLIARADAALYASKRHGRGRLTLAEPDGRLRELVCLPRPPDQRRKGAA